MTSNVMAFAFMFISQDYKVILLEKGHHCLSNCYNGYC